MSKQKQNSQAEAVREEENAAAGEAVEENNFETENADNPDASSVEPESAPEGEVSESGELAKLRMEAEENLNRYLRTQADFDNFRRRSRQEKEEFAKYASLKLIEQLLPIVDNFERAMESSRESKDLEALIKGLEMTFRQLDQLFEREGLEPIPAVGHPFNPELHQAIMQVESDEHEEGIIVEEVQKGYKLKDKVVRPSMVKVSM